MAPYRVHEITASSGRTCRIKVYAPNRDKVCAVDAAWSDPNFTEEDIQEMLAWARSQPDCAGAVGMVVDDEETFDSILKALRSDSN